MSHGHATPSVGDVQPIRAEPLASPPRRIVHPGYMPGQSQHINGDPVTQDQMTQVLHHIKVLALAQESHRDLPRSAVVGTQDGDGPTSPANAPFVRAIKWALGILTGGAVVIFGAGQGWNANATKADIDGRLLPVEARVTAIEQGLKPIKSGVATLVADRDKLHKIKLTRRKLRTAEREFEESLSDWKKRRRGARPRKRPDHLKLVDELKAMEDEI